MNKPSSHSVNIFSPSHSDAESDPKKLTTTRLFCDRIFHLTGDHLLLNTMPVEECWVYTLAYRSRFHLLTIGSANRVVQYIKKWAQRISSQVKTAYRKIFQQQVKLTRSDSHNININHNLSKTQQSSDESDPSPHGNDLSSICQDQLLKLGRLSLNFPKPSSQKSKQETTETNVTKPTESELSNWNSNSLIDSSDYNLLRQKFRITPNVEIFGHLFLWVTIVLLGLLIVQTSARRYLIPILDCDINFEFGAIDKRLKNSQCNWLGPYVLELVNNNNVFTNEPIDVQDQVEISNSESDSDSLTTGQNSQSENKCELIQEYLPNLDIEDIQGISNQEKFVYRLGNQLPPQIGMSIIFDNSKRCLNFRSDQSRSMWEYNSFSDWLGQVTLQLIHAIAACFWSIQSQPLGILLIKLAKDGNLSRKWTRIERLCIQVYLLIIVVIKIIINGFFNINEWFGGLANGLQNLTFMYCIYISNFSVIWHAADVRNGGLQYHESIRSLMQQSETKVQSGSESSDSDANTNLGSNLDQHNTKDNLNSESQLTNQFTRTQQQQQQVQQVQPQQSVADSMPSRQQQSQQIEIEHATVDNYVQWVIPYKMLGDSNSSNSKLVRIEKKTQAELRIIEQIPESQANWLKLVRRFLFIFAICFLGFVLSITRIYGSFNANGAFYKFLIEVTRSRVELPLAFIFLSSLSYMCILEASMSRCIDKLLQKHFQEDVKPLMNARFKSQWQQNQIQNHQSHCQIQSLSISNCSQQQYDTVTVSAAASAQDNGSTSQQKLNHEIRSDNLSDQNQIHNESCINDINVPQSNGPGNQIEPMEPVSQTIGGNSKSKHRKSEKSIQQKEGNPKMAIPTVELINQNFNNDINNSKWNEQTAF